MGPFARFMGGFLIRMLRQVPKGHIATWGTASGRGMKMAKIAEGAGAMWMAYEVLDILTAGPGIVDMSKHLKTEEEYKALATRAGLDPNAPISTIPKNPDVWAAEAGASITTDQAAIDRITAGFKAMMDEAAGGAFGTDEDKYRSPAQIAQQQAGCDASSSADRLRQLTLRTERAANTLGVPFGRMPTLIEDIRCLLASSQGELALIAVVRGTR